MTSVAALPDARLHVVFVDGTNGEVHLKSFLNSPTINGTVRGSTRSGDLRSGASHPRGSSVAEWGRLGTDTMYDAIREHGVWVLD
jgi:hypothetical protein